ncbi:MAG: glycosyltransferase [Candidatus Lokiarchaeota archaeon]|nr:glycosyltransferase [Candidatus Lokiarchaeota archaeon]
MKKIFIIGPPTNSIPVSGGGGIEKFVFELGNYLSKLDYDINIITIKDNLNNRKIELIKKNFKIIRISVPKTFFLRGLIYNIKISIKIGSLKQRNIVIFNDVSQSLIPIILKLFTNKLFSIFIMHNIRPWFEIKVHTKLRRLTDFILGIMSLRISDDIITFTDFFKGYLSSRFNIDTEKINVIPPGIPKEIIHNYQKIRNHEKSSEVFKMVYIGRIIESKGLETLLYAISRIQKIFSTKEIELKLLIIGPKTGKYGKQKWIRSSKQIKYLRKLNHLVKNLNLQNQVIFLGEVNSSKIYSLLLDSDLYICPSYGETFSLSALESLSVGIPVIISNTAGISEYLRHNKNCLKIAVNDINALVSTIKIAFNEKIRIRLGESGKKLVLNKFIWEELIMKYKEMFENV